MKKKMLILYSFLTLIFCSCSFFDVEDLLNQAKENLTIEIQSAAYDFSLPKTVDVGTFAFKVEWESSSSLIEINKSPFGNVVAEVDFESNTDSDKIVILTATISYFGNTVDKTFEILVPKYDLGEINAKSVDFENKLDKDGPLTEGCLPSTGNSKMLVIPVNLDSNNKTNKILNDIEIAFNGTSEQTGYESVKSYYQKSSYGKLNLDITVLDEWFTPKHSKKYYDNYYNDNSGDDGSTLILREALAYYDNEIDFSKYDSNNDGYIDSVWLVYNCDVDFESSDSLYWAFVYWDFSETTYDDKMAYYYAFGGIDFMYPTKDEAGTYDPTGIKVDAHTFIHETGHLLGLDDYYDYDELKGVDGGLYGADMMDFNIGDHCSISKLLLGWIDPIVVSGQGSITLDIKSLTSTGECIIITNRHMLSIYESYYIIEFYDNSGLNSFVNPINGYGVRVLKVNAEKNIVNGVVELNGGTYETGFKYDNSDESKLFVEMITGGQSVQRVGFSLKENILFTESERFVGDFFELIVDECNTFGATITINIA